MPSTIFDAGNDPNPHPCRSGNPNTVRRSDRHADAKPHTGAVPDAYTNGKHLARPTAYADPNSRYVRRGHEDSC